jgi:hypothetical protein
MTTSSGGDYPPPLAPDSDRLPRDHTGEPVGYNLGDAGVYQQPPAPPQPYRLPAAAPARTQNVVWGFVSSLLGLGALAFMRPPALGLGVFGALSCAIALVQSRRGAAINRRLAIAGLILGILGVVVAVVMILDFATGSATISPT